MARASLIHDAVHPGVSGRLALGYRVSRYQWQFLLIRQVLGICSRVCGNSVDRCLAGSRVPGHHQGSGDPKLMMMISSAPVRGCLCSSLRGHHFRGNNNEEKSYGYIVDRSIITTSVYTEKGR